MATNSTFVNRKTEGDEKDYITLANEQITKNGTIDPDSPTYKRAIAQYNAGLAKGSVERLEVPNGFCGYIDPNSGEFRVEPDGESYLKSSTPYPDNIVNPDDVPDVDPTQYPIDLCLAIGLPGSYEYTIGKCGDEDGDKSCSGIAWYSGGGTEEGTEALSQSVCGGGDGINSNTGIASSDSVGGIGATPPQVLEAANAAAVAENITAGYVFPPGVILTKVVGVLVTYDVYYNVYDPPNIESGETLKPAGLVSTVVWNDESKEVKSVTVTKRY